MLKNNFYGYVNNRWKNENPIPNEHTRWCTFTILNEQSIEFAQLSAMGYQPIQFGTKKELEEIEGLE